MTSVVNFENLTDNSLGTTPFNPLSAKNFFLSHSFDLFLGYLSFKIPKNLDLKECLQAFDLPNKVNRCSPEWISQISISSDLLVVCDPGKTATYLREVAPTKVGNSLQNFLNRYFHPLLPHRPPTPDETPMGSVRVLVTATVRRCLS